MGIDQVMPRFTCTYQLKAQQGGLIEFETFLLGNGQCIE